MASQAICGALVLLIAVSASNSLTLDEEAADDVIAAATSSEDGEIAILVRGAVGSHVDREELLHAKGVEDQSISLYYNSRSNKVSLECLNGGHIKSVSWSLGSHTHENLLLVVTHSRVKIYLGCKSLHWHPMSGIHDVLTILASQKLKLYREENAPIEIYESEKSAFASQNCNHENKLQPPTLMTVDDVEEVKDFKKKEERLRHEEQMQGDDPRNNYIDPNIYPPLPLPTTQRGDVPSVDILSCDDEIIRQLKILQQTVDLLRRELADQKGTIDGLRNQLHICCNRIPSPPVERCSGASCYPGY